MAKALSKAAFHEVLRRNLQFLAVDCPHSALIEAICVDELLPSLASMRMATVFNASSLVLWLDELESLDIISAAGAFMKILNACSGVGMGRLNSFLAVPAYRCLAKNLDSEIITKSAVRVMKHALSGVLRGATDSAVRCNDEIKWIACTCTVLHGYITSNQQFSAFCEAFGNAQESSRYQLLSLLLDVLHVGTQHPHMPVPLLKVLASIKSVLAIAFLGTQAHWLIFTPKSALRSPDKASGHVLRHSDVVQRTRTSSAFMKLDVKPLSSASEAHTALCTPVQHPRSSANRTPSGSATRRRAWSVEANGNKCSPSRVQPVLLAPVQVRAVSARMSVTSCDIFRALLCHDNIDRWSQLVGDLLSLLLASAPNLKAYTGKVQLQAEPTFLRSADIYDGDVSATTVHAVAKLPEAASTHAFIRRRDTVAKVTSDIMIFVLKSLGFGHQLQQEHFAAKLNADNACVLVLKYIAQDLMEFFSQPDFPAELSCDAVVEEALTDASAIAEGVRQQSAIGRRRSTTAVAPGFPLPTTFAPVAGAVAGPFAMHGILDASLTLCFQTEDRELQGQEVVSSSPITTLPRIAIRAVSAPAESPHLSIAAAIQSELVRNSPRSPIRRDSPTQTTRPLLDMAGLAHESTGPATDAPLRRTSGSLLDEAVLRVGPLTDVGLERMFADSNSRGAGGEAEARRMVLPRIASPEVDGSTSAEQTFEAAHVIAAAAGLSRTQLKSLDGIVANETSRCTGFPSCSVHAGGMVDVTTGQALSRRRVCIITNLLRVVRKVTKFVPERVQEQLVKTKSQLVLSKAASVDVIPVMFYSLKLLKAQVRLLGFWKRKNMPLITSIYRFVNLAPGADSWMATPGFDLAVAAVTQMLRPRTEGTLHEVPSSAAVVVAEAVTTLTASAQITAAASTSPKCVGCVPAAAMEAELQEFLRKTARHCHEAVEEEPEQWVDLTGDLLCDWLRLLV